MNVNEIFYSIDGEGIRAGVPCVFVRFNGCNLRCTYCDTIYAQDCDQPGIEMSPRDILNKVKTYGCPNVTLTGGEPCNQENIRELVSLLINNHFKVNIETNGSVDAPALFYSMANSQNLLITMDYKCKSSGMSEYMNIGYLARLRQCDVLKFVVGSEDDMYEALHVIDALSIQECFPQIFFSPIFGEIEPKEIVEFLKKTGLYQCRVQLQLHKYIWPPEERGV